MAENDDLIDRIIAATGIIQNATQRLRELTDEQFYAQSKTGVQTDVNAIIQEIENLIQSISNALQNGPASRVLPPPGAPRGQGGPGGPRRFDENGRPLAGGVSGGPVRGILESIETGLPPSGIPQRQGPNGAKKITIPEIKREMTLTEFINGLHRKAEQANRTGAPSKYQNAYDSLQSNNELKNNSLTPAQITKIITDTLLLNRILIKNGQLFGGKKMQKTQKRYKMRKSYNKHKKHQRHTKKLKQRGGFLYGDKKTTSTVSLTNSNKTASTNTISSSSKSQKSNNNKNKNKNKNKNTVKKMI